MSSAFGNAVMENWQSEYLQFTLYILLTIWFVQKGSPESKELGRQGRESDRDQLVGEHAGPDSPAWARTRGLRLRERGSPESKPVGAPHSATGAEG